MTPLNDAEQEFAATGVAHRATNDSLMALAYETQQAYPGRWFYLTEEFEEEDRPDVGNVWQEVSPGRATAVVHDTRRIAAEYLQEFQPSVVLDLLATIERLERALDVERRRAR
jgi:hypothetical protein